MAREHKIISIHNTFQNENETTSSAFVWPRVCLNVKSPLLLPSAVCLSVCIICLSSLLVSYACLLYLSHPDKALFSGFLVEHHRKMACGRSEGFFTEINRVLQHKMSLYWPQMIQKGIQNKKRCYQLCAASNISRIFVLFKVAANVLAVFSKWLPQPYIYVHMLVWVRGREEYVTKDQSYASSLGWKRWLHEKIQSLLRLVALFSERQIKLKQAGYTVGLQGKSTVLNELKANYKLSCKVQPKFSLFGAKRHFQKNVITELVYFMYSYYICITWI